MDEQDLVLLRLIDAEYTKRPFSETHPLAREFMRAFYQRWLTPEAIGDPAVALRATQRAWIEGADPVRADPRYWAPYVLIERG